MKRLALLLLAAALLAPAAAQGTQITGGAQPWQGWADASKMPTVPGPISVTVDAAPCGWAWAVGCASAGAAWIFLAPDADRRAFYHELGHLYDHAYLSDFDRANLAALLGQPGAAWHQAETTGGLGTPEELFAETYANCALGARRYYWVNNYGATYSLRRTLRVCAAVRLAFK